MVISSRKVSFSSRSITAGTPRVPLDSRPSHWAMMSVAVTRPATPTLPQNALELRRCEYSSWKIFLLLAVLSVALGIVMVVDPFGTMETLVMAIGLILILEGALNLLSALYTMLAVRRFIKLHPETQSMLEAITGQDLNGDGVIAPDVSHADVESTAVELDYVDESAEVEQENK